MTHVVIRRTNVTPKMAFILTKPVMCFQKDVHYFIDMAVTAIILSMPLLANMIADAVGQQQQVLVRSGKLYSSVKCMGTSDNVCITDQPTKSQSLISRAQCSVACNTLGWDWFNFIEYEDYQKFDVRRIGECQLFDLMPSRVARKRRCTAYKVGCMNDNRRRHSDDVICFVLVFI